MGLTGRDCATYVRQVIAAEKPDLVGFASPFVGQTRGKPKKFIKGKPVWESGNAPIPPDNIRPMFGCLTVIEMICDELNIRCVEVSEGEARRAFMTAVPRKSKDIKIAVQRACRLRRWAFQSEHDADALCVAAFILECAEPKHAHLTTPLFA